MDKEYWTNQDKANAPKHGLRFNSGKTRHDLVPPFAQEQYARVLTYGADKYTIKNEAGDIVVSGADNWRNGMSWRSVVASMKRHILAWENGDDYDFDPNCESCKKGEVCKSHSGLLHSAHIMCGAAFLTEYYRIHPQGDDRPHTFLKKPKIGLDIDEVLADWVVHWTKHHDQPIPENWNFDRDIAAKFEALKDDKEFWLSIPVKTPPSEIPFEPHCYITSRSIPKEWTEEWLDKNGFPTAKVFSIGMGQSKVEAAKESGIDIYVDDRYENFVELTNAGIFTYLFDAKHNRRYNVGFRRIYKLKELI